MADARERLNAALAGAPKATRVEKKAAPPKKASKPPPKKSAAPKKLENPKLKKEKPKKEEPKKKKKAKKKPVPAKKKSSSGGGGFGGAFSKFAKHLVNELKDATEDIKPKALLESASDSISSLRKVVAGDGSSNDATRVPTVPVSEDGGPSETPPERSPEPASGDREPAPAAASSASQSADQSPPADYSPAKVQRAAKKKPKPQPREASAGDEAEPVAAAADDTEASGSTEATSEVMEEASAEEAEASAPAAEGPSDSQAPSEPEISPAKVKRVASKKPKTEKQEAEEEPVAAEAEAEEESERLRAETSRVGLGYGRSATRRQHDRRTQLGLQAEAEAEGEPEQAEAEPAAVAEEESAVEGSGEEKSKEEKSEEKKRPNPAKQEVQLSKQEQALRALHCLQMMVQNPVWSPVALDLEAKPSTLYAPRDRFDEQFVDDSFREGLRAANRLASAYSIDPEKIRIDEEVVEKVKIFDVDPERKIKKDDDLLENILGEEQVKKCLVFYNDKSVRLLLLSVATHLGSFVPSIEILARIYLGLRKGTDIIPGQRLAIQEEVLMRYQKSQYTDAKAKKARLLALKYYTDWLSDYGMRMYRERYQNAPPRQGDVESSIRRHQSIKEHCFRMMDDRGVKVGLGAPAVINMKARFAETADLFIKEELGDMDIPEDLEKLLGGQISEDDY